MSQETADTKKYVSILASDGTFRFPVPEGTPNSVERKWTVDDKSGVKHELVWKSITGKITNVEIVVASFGSLLQITVNDEAGDLTISIPQGNNFAIDLMKKLPNVNLEKEVKLTPYSFENEKGQAVKGVTLEQEGVKITNFFYDGEKNINGFPTPEGDTTKYTKNKWKSYFGTVEDFLVEYIKTKFTTEDVPF